MTSSNTNEAEEIVGGQLAAYNARDIDAFMAYWHDDALYYEHPATLLAEGAAAIRQRHEIRFAEPLLFGQLLTRVSVGNLVVDREVVRRTFAGGVGTVDVIAIYEVSDGKIAKAWFKLGTPKLDTVTDH
ncbi:nuclear transport factor 2 family protein [Silvimonas sp.]|uniref:nuclear transport factor 2 family protein n=1 Tax=Silvimonas sp. TaxID=2650811 RepID=UPI00283BE8CA|nr:nuclear transport factor 2 family protein [Silvimonas sp.]MDR3429624.1 nuclear transport factor 2 family protein [Silvimonas sp.]